MYAHLDGGGGGAKKKTLRQVNGERFLRPKPEERKMSQHKEKKMTSLFYDHFILVIRFRLIGVEWWAGAFAPPETRKKLDFQLMTRVKVRLGKKFNVSNYPSMLYFNFIIYAHFVKKNTCHVFSIARA